MKQRKVFVCVHSIIRFLELDYVFIVCFVQHLVNRGPGSLPEILGATIIAI